MKTNVFLWKKKDLILKLTFDNNTFFTGLRITTYMLFWQHKFLCSEGKKTTLVNTNNYCPGNRRVLKYGYQFSGCCVIHYYLDAIKFIYLSLYKLVSSKLVQICARSGV